MCIERASNLPLSANSVNSKREVSFSPIHLISVVYQFHASTSRAAPQSESTHSSIPAAQPGRERSRTGVSRLCFGPEYLMSCHRIRPGRHSLRSPRGWKTDQSYTFLRSILADRTVLLPQRRLQSTQGGEELFGRLVLPASDLCVKVTPRKINIWGFRTLPFLH